MEKDNEKIFIVSLLTRANLRVLSRICKIGESISYMSYPGYRRNIRHEL